MLMDRNLNIAPQTSLIPPIQGIEILGIQNYPLQHLNLFQQNYIIIKIRINHCVTMFLLLVLLVFCGGF